MPEVRALAHVAHTECWLTFPSTAPFTLKQVQSIFKLVFGQNTARRSIEMGMIAPSTFRLKIVNGTRILGFDNVYAERKGAGSFAQSVASLPSVEACPVTWFLLLAQGIGMIDSALDCWDRKEELAPDPALRERRVN